MKNRNKNKNLIRVESGVKNVGSIVESLRYYRTFKSAQRAATMIKNVHKKDVSSISPYTPIDKRRIGGFIFAVYK